MINKKRSESSNRWLKDHFNDKYVIESQKKGFRSRAWFKLDEIQHSDKILKFGMNVIDLGSSPGSWSQYAIKKVGRKGMVIACDLLLMKPIFGVKFLQGDLLDKKIFNKLIKLINNKKIQVIMSDIAPNMSGIPQIDIPKSMYLFEFILNICHNILIIGGNFIIKIFHGEGFEKYLNQIRSLFLKVKIRKLNASRLHSREVYIVATGYKI